MRAPHSGGYLHGLRSGTGMFLAAKKQVCSLRLVKRAINVLCGFLATIRAQRASAQTRLSGLGSQNIRIFFFLAGNSVFFVNLTKSPSTASTTAPSYIIEFLRYFSLSQCTETVSKLQHHWYDKWPPFRFGLAQMLIALGINPPSVDVTSSSNSLSAHTGIRCIRNSHLCPTDHHRLPRSPCRSHAAAARPSSPLNPATQPHHLNQCINLAPTSERLIMLKSKETIL